VDRIHIGQDTYVLRRSSQMETTRAWCGQATKRGRLKARQGTVCVIYDLVSKIQSYDLIRWKALEFRYLWNKFQCGRVTDDQMLLCWTFQKCLFYGSLIKCVITQKLPLLQRCHIFSSTRGVCLSKITRKSLWGLIPPRDTDQPYWLYVSSMT